MTFGFWARGTWFGGRRCLLLGGLCGFCGGRRCGGVSATVLTSSSMYAGDMFQRSAAQCRRDCAALRPELAAALREVVYVPATPVAAALQFLTGPRIYKRAPVHAYRNDRPAAFWQIDALAYSNTLESTQAAAAIRC